MKQESIIGVIGGMGPYAGLDLVHKIFDETLAATDQEHVPVALLSYSPRIQDRSAFIFGAIQENPGYAIAGVAAALETLGASVAGMPCNSAHMPPIFDVTRQRLRDGGHTIRLLHLVDETIQHVRSTLPHVKRVGPLSTLGTFRTGLYEKAIKAAGLFPVMPTETVQADLVHRAIYDTQFGIKAHSAPVTARASAMVRDAIDHLRTRGAEVVILGCTELPMAVSPDDDPTLIDPARALARALLRETYPHKLRPLGAAR